MERAEAEAIYGSGREGCVEFILELAASVERLSAACELLEDRVRRLETEARRDSRTSSAPPSQDPPKTRQQRRAEARAKAKELLASKGTKRNAGGQAGHAGAGRRLAGEDQVDEIVAHYPQACGGCGREFSEDERRPGGRFGRHQVAELAPISVLVSEHRTQRLRCPDCRAETTAALPAGIGSSAFGPRLRAAIVTLTARNRISRRAASELAGEMFGARLSIGSVDAICQHASDLLAAPYEHLDADRRQVCWSHLQRDFRRHSEALAEQKTFGKAGVALTGRVFAAWRAFRDQHHDRDQLITELAPVQAELLAHLERAARKSKRTRLHRRFANNLLKVWPALWTFATHTGVEPTNNPAERALRTPVIHRKLSHGTRTDDGERFTERALSAVTCRQQHRSLFDFLTELLAAHSRGDPLPALT